MAVSSRSAPPSIAGPSTVSPDVGTSGRASIGGSLGPARNRSRVQADDALANGLNLVATTDKPTMPVVLDHKGKGMRGSEKAYRDGQTRSMESCQQGPLKWVESDRASWPSRGTWPQRQGHCGGAEGRSATRRLLTPPDESVLPAILPAGRSEVGETHRRMLKT